MVGWDEIGVEVVAAFGELLRGCLEEVAGGGGGGSGYEREGKGVGHGKFVGCCWKGVEVGGDD